MKNYSLPFFLLLCMFHYQSFAAKLTLESTAFKMNTLIPQEYTCNGVDKSPPLSWRNVPKNTQSFALIVEDPDAPNGLWTHWILINIPPTLNQLDEDSTVPKGVEIGKNSWNSLSYNGPCPSIGTTHAYHFKLYALDTILSLGEGTTRDIALNAMTGHVIGSTDLVGYYQSMKK
jgi:Raf kinase inhibitor-like YbhB/YbcL family protein